jgi:hypothetical protein
VLLFAGIACSDNGPADTPGAMETNGSQADGVSPAETSSIDALTEPLGAPGSSEERADGSMAWRWLVPVSSAERVAEDLAARIEDSPEFALTAVEITSRGAIVAFAGERSGHFLVTRSTEQGTPVELVVDAPVAEMPAPTSVSVPLPEGYPADVLPVFPGATITSAEADMLDGTTRRFALELETDRAAVEVLGFYADVLTADGWDIEVAPGSVIATREDRLADRVEVRDLERLPTTLALRLVRAAS